MRPCSRIRLSTKIFFNQTLFCFLKQQLIIFVLRKAMGPTELGSLSLRSRQPCPSEQPSAVHTSNDWLKEIVEATNTWKTIFKTKPKATIQKLPAVINTWKWKCFCFLQIGSGGDTAWSLEFGRGQGPKEGAATSAGATHCNIFLNPFLIKWCWCLGAGCFASGGTTTGCAADVQSTESSWST